MMFTDVSDKALLTRLYSLRSQENHLLAQVVVMLNEVEDRRLYLEQACSSMWDFCRRKLGLSDGATHRRLTAAEMARMFPKLVGAIERGEINLSNLVALKPVLREENFDALVREASGMRKKQVEALVARLAPKPDVPTTLREERTTQGTVAATSLTIDVALPALAADVPIVLPLSLVSSETTAPTTPAAAMMFAVDAASTSVGLPTGAAPGAATVTPRRHDRGRIEALSATRHKLQMSISGEVRAKLERAVDLMRHRNPSGSLEVVLDKALDVLLQKLEREICATSKRANRKKRVRTDSSATDSSATDSSANDGSVTDGSVTERSATTEGSATEGSATERSATTEGSATENLASEGAAVLDEDDGGMSPKDRAVPRETRRAVWERDGGQCTFRSEEGERCPATTLLEIDHIVARAMGGSNKLPNL